VIADLASIDNLRSPKSMQKSDHFSWIEDYPMCAHTVIRNIRKSTKVPTCDPCVPVALQGSNMK
jgi:hypothetical protein